MALFAGLGGLITAGNRAGFETIYANDNDPFCLETLEATCKSVLVSQTDKKQISLKNKIWKVEKIDIPTDVLVTLSFVMNSIPFGTTKKSNG